MDEGDNKPAGKVIPFAKSIQGAIAEELRRMYGSLVREKLPDDISALLGQFEERAKKDSEEKK
jgi:Anti-sigma factor NepR